jgi:hypothetical protein
MSYFRLWMCYCVSSMPQRSIGRSACEVRYDGFAGFKKIQTANMIRLACVAHITNNTDTTKELILVDKEEAYERMEGVMNLSKDYGQLGILWVTNLRIVWAASLQHNYNCSVPFIQVSSAAF